MSKPLVFDLPTRLFHWSFAGFFAISYIIANIVDDESSVFPFHSLSGICLVFILTLRLIWGIFGTKYARFTSYKLNPSHLFTYLKDIMSGQGKRGFGRNPASSWAAITMMLISLGLGLTGYLMATGSGSEIIKETHELLANGFFLVVLLHIAGIVLHTIRHKDPIGLSMVTGTKISTEDKEIGIEDSKKGIGLLYIMILLSFITILGTSYNPQQHSINLFGTSLQLGEVENENGENVHEYEENEKEDDDDD